tara:strand:+ start:1258 stop:2541 length:1284 start_codon:yes stop_codon:yes gene_type:complete
MFLNKIFEIFNKYSPILIHTPWAGAIGNMAEEIYMALLRARRENKKVLLLFPYDAFGKFKFSKFGLGMNSELKDIRSEYRFLNHNHPLSVFLNIILSLIFYLFKTINFLLKYFGLGLPENYLIPSIDKKNLWDINKSNKFEVENELGKIWQKDLSEYLDVRLSQKSIAKGEKVLKEMGIPKNSWFACFFIRDNSYYGQKVKEGDEKVIRNSSLENYYMAMEQVVKRGGYVVRLGNNKMKKMKKMKNVIDYPFTQFKSDLMDVYLVSKCKFFLGGSGIWDVGHLFQKPLLMPNCVPIIYVTAPRKNDIMLYKHIKKINENHYLTLNYRVQNTHPNKSAIFDEYEYIENSADEIESLVVDYFDNIENYNSPKQIAWKKTIQDTGLNFLKNNQLYDNNYKNLSEKYRRFSKLFGRNGYVSNKILNEYFVE